MVELKRKNSPIHIFMDSDAFVALLKQDDQNHKKAERVFNALKNNDIYYSTSNYIFSEVVTVISQKINHATALKFIQYVRSAESGIKIRWVTEEIETLAIEIFESQTSKNTSFVDCTNMAIMSIDRLDVIFSFDAIYKKNGFDTIFSLKK